MSSEGDDVAADITRAYQALCAAMVDAHTDELSDLLASDFTLTHMTGYLQPKREWLNDIGSDRMTYHSIRNVTIDTKVDGTEATLIGRSHTHATIWGAEGTWPLELRVEYLRTTSAWVAQRIVATTW
ncbi:nuclear transport factor 2 family protein [Microbacterium atlanticum]|uniref:nuclear transport factor 2 family protein n=1 Tax=Microbacterium atlanticum TaxID=2782168 RepID=UPI001888F815|nr:nuclear transport factor 2 family protein [Microbacterium atlanticum]